jgi:hypothetical protein
MNHSPIKSEFSLGNVIYIQYLCGYEQDPEDEENYDVVSKFDVPRDISIEIGFLG